MPRKPGEKILNEEKREKNRVYNIARPATHAFYSSMPWRKLREYVKRRNPLCAECLRNGIVTQGTLVDHIVPIEEGGAKMDLSNLQVLCAACHNKKHGEGRSKSLNDTNTATAAPSKEISPKKTNFPEVQNEREKTDASNVARIGRAGS
mgnify:CR=1 FL=1